MATAATRLGENLLEKYEPIHLTPTGLLMEGGYTQNPDRNFSLGMGLALLLWLLADFPPILFSDIGIYLHD